MGAMPKFNPKNQILKKQKKKNNLIENRTLASDIILFGINNERSARIMEKDNTLTFRCKNDATKKEIKEAFLEIYNEKITKINTVNTMKGIKKAYIRLLDDGAALKVATEAGIL